MKKKLLVVMALLLCLSLLACNKNPTPSEPNGTSSIVMVPKPDSLPTEGWHLPMQWHADTFAATEDGVFFLNNSCLCFLDTKTGCSVYLCSKVGCDHGERNETDCDAFIPGMTMMMFFHDGRIYYDIYDEYGTHLYARNADGTGLQEIATLCAGHITKDTSVSIREFSLADNYLYYSVVVEGVTELEDGSFYSEPIYEALMRFDLRSGKEEELFRTEDETVTILGTTDDMVLIIMRHLVTIEETQRPDYKDYITQFPAYLRLWSGETGGVSQLSELDRDLSGRFSGFFNGKAYFLSSDKTSFSSYDLASGTFGKADLPEDVTRIWNERYGAVMLDGYYDLVSGEYFANDYGTMTLPSGIDDFGASLTIVDTGLVWCEFYSKDSKGVYDQYAYVPFERLADGMQLSDRMVFIYQDDDGSKLVQPES